MIAIIDYDAGNTFNVQKALAYIGLETVLTADSATILNRRICASDGSSKRAWFSRCHL